MAHDLNKVWRKVDKRKAEAERDEGILSAFNQISIYRIFII